MEKQQFFGDSKDGRFLSARGRRRIRAPRLFERSFAVQRTATPGTDLRFLLHRRSRKPDRATASPVGADPRVPSDRIAAIDPRLDAYLLVTAGEQSDGSGARRGSPIMAGNYRGPMHGVPFALEDIYWNTSIRTTAAGTYTDYVQRTSTPPPSPSCVGAVAILLRRAGRRLGFAHSSPSFDLPWPAGTRSVEPRACRWRIHPADRVPASAADGVAPV